MVSRIPCKFKCHSSQHSFDSRNVKLYSFQIILAIGYRVRSNIGTHFRNFAPEFVKWATIRKIRVVQNEASVRWRVRSNATTLIMAEWTS
ncbi:MAG: virulence RhuM family protein [Coriobacteriia bacterium]|nr:virulence RhuM family protein [Coriobacteriia bacterium]